LRTSEKQDLFRQATNLAQTRAIDFGQL